MGPGPTPRACLPTRVERLAMRLEGILIENFRGIRALELDFDPFTVIIAENNHGKTSVFDVLGLCLGPRGVDPDSLFRDEDFYRAPDGEVGDIRLVLTFTAPSGESCRGWPGFPSSTPRCWRASARPSQTPTTG